MLMKDTSWRKSLREAEETASKAKMTPMLEILERESERDALRATLKKAADDTASKGRARGSADLGAESKLAGDAASGAGAVAR